MRRVVLTGAVRRSERGHTRRQVLGAGAAVTTLAGCGLLGDDGPAPPGTPDPLRPVLEEALTLAAAYDRAAVAEPGLSGRLAPLAEDHRAHAAELSRVIGTALPSGPAAGPSSGAAPAGTGSGTVLAGLRAAEQAAQRTAVAACRRAPATRVALVGSIAACRATHAEALR